jgi:hypothetical protein
MRVQRPIRLDELDQEGILFSILKDLAESTVEGILAYCKCSPEFRAYLLDSLLCIEAAAQDHRLDPTWHV